MLEVDAPQPPSQGKVNLHFVVRDTGIGIAQEKQKLIFDPFCQADSSTTRKYGGTGLGLTVSGRLVHMMGGEIFVNSVPGKGSDFHFTAKVGLASPTALPENMETMNCLANAPWWWTITPLIGASWTISSGLGIGSGHGG